MLARIPEAGRPPLAAAPARRGRGLREAARRERPGQFGAERVDPRLQRVVEHPADHHHPAGKPLPHPAEIGMVELRHRAVAALQGPDQVAHRVQADPVAVGDGLQPGDGVERPVVPEGIGRGGVGRIHEPAPEASEGGQEARGAGPRPGPEGGRPRACDGVAMRSQSPVVQAGSGRLSRRPAGTVPRW
ncbi:hypothetical protein SR39_22360 [Methylobacterium radiotolerans]|nr:hypothetical protein SR39_22360 [Methylobacterium radiotolerans]